MRKTKTHLYKILLIILLIVFLFVYIKNKDTILNIFLNNRKIKSGIPSTMNIGQLINYNHKVAANPSDSWKLKTSIKQGTASTPGSGIYKKYPEIKEQSYDATTTNTDWRILNIDRANDEIMIISDNIMYFDTYGSIDYIWFEHNRNQIASIYGYGKGAKKKTFTYKVGSQLEDTGDTATWSTGINGIPLSGARAFRLEDIENAYGWTKSDIRTQRNFIKSWDYEFEKIFTKNVAYPQRKVSGMYQRWENESLAVGYKHDVRVFNDSYTINKENIPDGILKNIIFNINSHHINVELGNARPYLHKSGIAFCRSIIFDTSINKAHYAFMGALIGGWSERDFIYNTHPARAIVYLSSSDVKYVQSKSTGSNGEIIWNIEDKQKLPQGMQIGDIINYDHTATGIKIEKLGTVNVDQAILKTTLDKGTAEKPGSHNKQDMNANNIKPKWYVWGVDDTTGDVLVVSESVLSYSMSGAIDHIWYEHNMHKIAKIFGHGKGVKKKVFEYKVGSQLENVEDTATWRTGGNGIELSGSRPLKLDDIERAFGWTESTIKADSKFTKWSNFWKTEQLNISFPQRKVAGLNQSWENESIAKSAKRYVKATNKYYKINKNDTPNNVYRNILWDWNVNKAFNLGNIGLALNSQNLYFGRDAVIADQLGCGYYYFINSGVDGTWKDGGGSSSCRVLTTLSSSDVIYTKTGATENGKNIWNIDLKKVPNKNITVDLKNKYGKNISGLEVGFRTETDNGSLLKNINISNLDSNTKTFSLGNVAMRKNKYKMYVKGIPSDAEYKILSRYNEIGENTHELNQDILTFNSGENIKYDVIIYPKKGNLVVPIKYTGGKNDTDFSMKAKIKLKKDGDSREEVITLKRGLDKYIFSNVEFFNQANNELFNISIDCVKENSKDKHIINLKNKEINVTYVPPEEQITVNAEFIFGQTLDEVPVVLKSDNGLNQKITLTKLNNYKFTKFYPIKTTDGDVIKYKLEKDNIKYSKYITSISGFTITIRPVLTLPMSGSDSMKLIGITAGVCSILGLGLRVKNKLIIFFKKYEIMK